PAVPGVMHDIWDSNALKTFCGPNGKPFFSCPQGKSCLAFGLHVDNFSIGKWGSRTAIYMTCLNLPPSWRHQLENIFLVGLIPGPWEPSITQMNHLLRPLIPFLGDLWDEGLFLKHTPNYPFGH
ncbi:hypothetical protein P691DRAFT_683904, partial [Macrolepiota fuliginosa MF-IS2]